MRAFILLTLISAFSFTANAYEYCTRANDFLENLLPDVIDNQIPAILPERCIEAAHLSLAPTGYYGFCPTAMGMPTRSHPRPCVSRKYVGAVHSALIAVADCLDYDPRLAFATFNLESAAHLTAVGAATDVGIGQLTRSAIEEVTLNALPAARRRATASTKLSCKKILPYMTDHPAEKEKRCGYMSLPENPWRNLIYSILLIQQNRKAVDRYFTRLNIQLPPTANEEIVKEHLTHLAYNAGSAGGAATLAAYAEIMGPRASDRLLNFESTDFYGFPNFMARYFPVPAGKESTRKRISKYVFYVGQAARRVEKLAGQTCFDPATFPQPDNSKPVPFNTTPDWTHASQLVEENMVYLAQEFAEGQKSNRNCKAKQAQFQHEFLPNGITEKDLTKPLDQIYNQLCN